MSSILDIQHLDTEHIHPTHPAHRPYREALAAEPTVRVRHLSLVPTPASDDARPPVRLTRRGRLAMFLSTVLMLVVLGVVLGSTTVATDEPGVPVPATMVTVNPGQTLWDIAAKANPTGDIQVTVDDIMKLNALASGTSLQAGDTIAVPLYK
jgi:LysM repeat protein